MSQFDYLAGYSRIIVTGPWRSGTTIAAHMIAYDTGKRYIDEWDFGAIDPDRWRALVMAEKDYVMQAPCMCRYAHEFGNVDGLAVVLMRRSIKDIIASQKRIGMSGFKPELQRYGVSKGILSEIKYEYWDKYQVNKIKNVYEVQYSDLEKHPLFVPKIDRLNFTPKQWQRAQA